MKRKGIQAFTLVELLVATSILAALTLVLLSISNQASSVWQSGESDNQRRKNARLLMNFIGEELKMASLPLVRGADDSLHFQINSNAHVGDGDGLMNPDTLFFQAPIADDLSRGRTMALGYFVRWDGLSPALYRLSVGASDSEYVDDDPNAAIAAFLGTGALDEFLFLENVMGLWVKAYDASGNAVSSWDSRVTHDLPSYVEVSLLVVDARHILRLTEAVTFTHEEIDNPDAVIDKLPEAVRPGARLVSIKVHLDRSISGAIPAPTP